MGIHPKCATFARALARSIHKTGNRGAHGCQKHTSERSGLQAVVGLVAVTHVLTKNGIELASFVKYRLLKVTLKR